MSLQRQQDFDEANRIRPDLSGYQDRIVSQGAEAIVERDKDLMIEAPTGAGKTAILSKLAQKVLEREGGKVLILTHRRNLLKAMAGDPDATEVKKRMGEIAFWTGDAPGTIAEQKLGGVNQDPGIVAAMVVSAANLENLEDYSLILIDEAHHASGESADREVAGAYANLIQRCPNAKVAGVTATTFRGDEDKLHPRLEAAERYVVGVEETQNEQRTVPIKTYVSKTRLKNGLTPSEVYEEKVRGKIAGSAAKLIKTAKDDDYYWSCIDEVKDVIGDGKTIVFCDDVDEVKDVTRLLKERFGEGAASMVYGEQGDKHNNSAMKGYAERDVQFLVSCQMIGEGYDVPETDSVLSFNSSLTRGQMNQFGGRSVRFTEGRTHGKYIDCGTGTARFGPLEEQHAIQTVRAAAFSGDAQEEVRALSRASAYGEDGWHVLPGKDKTLFYKRENESHYRGFQVIHDAMSENGKRAGKDVDRGRSFQPLLDQDGLSVLSTKTLCGIVGEHVQNEAGFIARSGGLRGQGYRRAGETMMKGWKGKLDELGQEPAVDSSAKRREAHIRSAVRGDRHYQVGLRATLGSLREAPNKEAALREGLRLSGVALDEMNKLNGIPTGASKEMKVMTTYIGMKTSGKMSSSDLLGLSETVGSALSGIGSTSISKSGCEVASRLGEMVSTCSGDLQRKNDAKRDQQIS